MLLKGYGLTRFVCRRFRRKLLATLYLLITKTDLRVLVCPTGTRKKESGAEDDGEASTLNVEYSWEEVSQVSQETPPEKPAGFQGFTATAEPLATGLK